jgi:hypothetical protein
MIIEAKNLKPKDVLVFRMPKRDYLFSVFVVSISEAEIFVMLENFLTYRFQPNQKIEIAEER